MSVVLLEQKSTRIGVHGYKVTMLDAHTGRRAFVRLFKIVGSAYATLAGGNEEAAFRELIEKLTPEELDYFCDTFATVTEVSGGKHGAAKPQLDDIFALHFAGNYFEMFEWLTFCFKLNFASFFDGATARLAVALKAKADKVKSDSSSPTTSTGGSGDS
jgi:hypothetical protein